MKARLIVLAITLLFTLSAGNTVGERYDAASDIATTREIEYDSWDAYELHGSGKKVDISVSIVEGTSVDFYLFTEDQYDDYTNPFATQMGYEANKEITKTYSYSGSNVNYVFVIDNADISQSGATSTGNVTYEIEIKYSEMSITDNLVSFLTSGFCICGGAIVLAVITSLWLYTVPKQYKERAQKLKELGK